VFVTSPCHKSSSHKKKSFLINVDLAQDREHGKTEPMEKVCNGHLNLSLSSFRDQRLFFFGSMRAQPVLCFETASRSGLLRSREYIIAYHNDISSQKAFQYKERKFFCQERLSILQYSEKVSVIFLQRIEDDA